MKAAVALLSLVALAPFAVPAAETGSPAQPVIAQAADRTVILHAKEATTHGATIRYEPQPHKNTIGYWTQQGDSVSWEFTLNQPGRFAVELVQGCGAGSGGSQVALWLDDQKFLLQVVETGGFQNFLPRVIGAVRLSGPGRHRCRVEALTKPGVAVMDLRQINLRPLKD